MFRTFNRVFYHLVKTLRTSLISVVIVAAFVALKAHAQNASSTNDVIKQKLLAYTQPESALQTQIQEGLKRLKSLCDRTAVPTPQPGKSSSQAEVDGQDRLFKKILTTKLEAKNQKRKFDLGIEQFRNANRLGELAASCGALPSMLRLSSSCRSYDVKSERLQLVVGIAEQYYLDVGRRFDHYIEGIDLESQGCARTGFTQRLWVAEEAHMIPRMQGSATFFLEQMNTD